MVPLFIHKQRVHGIPIRAMWATLNWANIASLHRPVPVLSAGNRSDAVKLTSVMSQTDISASATGWRVMLARHLPPLKSDIWLLPKWRASFASTAFTCFQLGINAVETWSSCHYLCGENFSWISTARLEARAAAECRCIRIQYWGIRPSIDACTLEFCRIVASILVSVY